ncbi:MAG: hypothetical protein AB7V46_14205 [Thermomicrobiales bacterium]|uniref:hypothetical protein n=1 Tax=Pseudorhodoplanes sp. TaxID=1934341 RepID=UPI003D12D2DA
MSVGNPRKPAKLDADELERYLKIWEKLVELDIFHQTLKQQRLAHFIPIQLALGAAYGLCLDKALILEPTLSRSLVAWTVLGIGVAFFAFRHSRATLSMDQRAQQYVMTVKNEARGIEFAIRHHFRRSIPQGPCKPKAAMLPYTHMFWYLSPVAYRAEAAIAKGETLHATADEGTASRTEERLISSVSFVWIILGLGPAGLLAYPTILAGIAAYV